MDRIQASLDRLQALWHQLARAKQDSPEYNEIVKRIRAESDAYNKLAEDLAALKPPN